MLFKEHPFLERPKAAAAAGFTGIECQLPYHHPAEELAEKLMDVGVPLVLFNAPPGDYAAGERGLAALPGRERDFRESLEVAIAYADALECSKLHVMAGIVPEEDVEAALDTYVANMGFAAEACATEGITVLIEPILMDGYLISRPEQAVEIVQAVDHKNLRLQYDLYHAQRTQGSLSEFIENNLELIGHIQVAGVPGRHEPDKLSEVNWRFIFDLLDAHGYGGWIGAEYEPRADTLTGLAWARDWGIGGATRRFHAAKPAPHLQALRDHIMIKIYGLPPSRTARVIWTVEELGLPYEVLTVDFRKGEHKKPDFLKLNPMGLIPALQDGDVFMTESLAINLVHRAALRHRQAVAGR